MLKFIKYICSGICFGIILTKAEVISWYRIYEMFKFQSFHMYGIIGSAVVIGILAIQLMKAKRMKTFNGSEILFSIKKHGFARYIFGGTIFGLGWALTGACPGPLFTLFGAGVSVILVSIVAAILGTLFYGIIHKKLPH